MGSFVCFNSLTPVSRSNSFSRNYRPLKDPSLQRSSRQPNSRSSTSREHRSLKLNTEVSPHRAVSAVRLLRIEQGGAFADLLNGQREDSREQEMGYVERTLGFRIRDLDDRDVRLVTDIVGGTVRWRRYLDYVISSFCNDPDAVNSMEPLLLQILRMGAYELVKLNIPSHAVVNENVTLAKTALRPGAGSMVNGILRKLVLCMEKDSLPLPSLEGDERGQARALATIYSHPVWMVRRWTKYFGLEDTVRLMTWNNSTPCFCLRPNHAKGITRADLIKQLKALEVHVEPSPYTKDFVHLRTGMQAVLQAGLLRDGICAVQDESAGLVVSVVNPQQGETIIDCCAAPGGKTLFMASCLRGQGSVLAIDINPGRLRVLEDAARQHSVDDIVNTIHADLRMFAAKTSIKADKVLLDAPCSGMGVLSKRADLRWNRKAEDMEQLQNLQDELLDAAAMLVKPGGVLVYSTCSIDPGENAERVTAFLHRHMEFSVDPVDRYVPQDFVTEEGFYSSNPVRHSLDGSFAARLIRQ
ncbi:uncharacterized protein LOC116258939 [Nymphaea colorata]|nr:uncharacterized protein LOC116258939 [Nymphaea colorata]